MNPENQINGKQEVRKMSKNDHRHENEKTIRPKNELYCIELNIWPDLHLVNFEVLSEKVKNFTMLEDILSLPDISNRPDGLSHLGSS